VNPCSGLRRGDRQGRRPCCAGLGAESTQIRRGRRSQRCYWSRLAGPRLRWEKILVPTVLAAEEVEAELQGFWSCPCWITIRRWTCVSPGAQTPAGQLEMLIMKRSVCFSIEISNGRGGLAQDHESCVDRLLHPGPQFPRYFNMSPECRRELQFFAAQRARNLGVDGTSLYCVDVPSLAQ